MTASATGAGVVRVEDPESGAAVDDADRGLATLYRLYSGPLFGYVSRLTLGDHRQAEDILQETFLRAWRTMQAQPLNAETMRPWLYTVARRLVVDGIRARSARPQEVAGIDLTLVPATDDPIDRMLIGHAVRDGLEALWSEHRAILIESFYRDKSPSEIAAQLGIPVGTVKSRTHYALRALRAAVID